MPTYAEIRSAIFGYLRTHRTGQVPSNLSATLHTLTEQGHTVTDADLALARQVFHELYLELIILPGNNSTINTLSGHLLEWPFYTVTEYGNSVLDNPDYQAHDPDGYLQKLKQQIPNIDPDIIRYLEESLRCYKHGLLLASAVMLGCAAEKAMLLLIEAFGNAITDTTAKGSYEQATRPWVISKKYEAFWSRLEPLAPNLPEPLRNDLHTVLDQIFGLIRRTRNAAGHPTGRTIERDTMYAHLIIFPTYLRRVYALISHFVANSV